MLKPYIVPAVILGSVHVLYILAAILYPKKQREKINETMYSAEHIVCFKNESKFIAEKLKNCYETDYPYLHHTFVNDNSTDDTWELLNKYKQENTTLINNEISLGKNCSQLKAVNHTKADLLLFTDANVFLEKDAVNHLIRYFDENTGGVCGDVTITTDMERKEIGGRYWEIEKIIKRFQSSFGAVIGFDGGFYCVKNAYYNLTKENELSDFETAFLITRQGKETQYAADAIAVEVEKRKIKDLFKARIRSSNRVFWSFKRIFKYINRLKLSVIIHFIFHKLIRYIFIITFTVLLPFIMADLWRVSPFLLLIFCVPYVYRFIIECIGLCIGGIVALKGEEYTCWSNKKI